MLPRAPPAPKVLTNISPAFSGGLRANFVGSRRKRRSRKEGKEEEREGGGGRGRRAERRERKEQEKKGGMGRGWEMPPTVKNGRVEQK